MVNWLSIFRFRIFLHVVSMSTYQKPLMEMYIFPTQSACNVCQGAGKMLDIKPSGANNQGLIRKEEVIEIDIPAGVEDGMQLSVSGKGNAGPFNGIAGDLIVVIEEVESEDLRRDGEHLHFDAYVNFVDAVLGESIEIPTVSGKAKIKVEPGTQSGKVLRLKGKGLPVLQGYGHGDLFVHINVWTPKKVSKEEKEILESLKKSENFEPSPDHHDKGFFHRMKDMFQTNGVRAFFPVGGISIQMIRYAFSILVLILSQVF